MYNENMREKWKIRQGSRYSRS